MRPKTLLRIAVALLVFHLVGHTLGHLGWESADDLVQQEVIKQMTEHQFPFMGAVHSIGDYYEGYGWTASVALVFFALILWFSSSAIVESKSLVQKILLSLTLCLFVWAALEFWFFFPFAGAITLTAGLLSVASYVRLRTGRGL